MYIYYPLPCILTTMSTALRVEWAKCKARASRWREEIMLLEEEMRRSIAYATWKANWWQQQAERRAQLDPRLGGPDTCLAEGLRAYALEHQQLELSMASQLEVAFQGIRERAATVLAQLENGSVSELETLIVDIDIDDGGDDGEVL